MAGRKGGPKKEKGEEIEPSPSSPIDEAEKVPETVNIAAKKTIDEPAYRKAATRLVVTGPELANVSKKQLASGTVPKFGMVKIGQWTFRRGELKVVYVTPEILAAAKGKLLEGINYNIPKNTEAAES